MKSMRFTIITFSLCLLILLLSACENQYEYRNNDVDLYTIAVNSLLGAAVYESDKILNLETDDFGRKLFAYEGFTCNGTSENGRIFAVLVSQKTTDTEAYFYDNVNFLYCGISSANQYKVLTKQQVRNCFTDEQIASLKAYNDWNSPLDESRFFTVKIQSRKTDTVPKNKLKRSFLMIAAENEYENSNKLLLTTDKNRKSIYCIRVKPEYATRGDYIFLKSYVMLFDEKGNVDAEKGIMEIENVWNYQEQLLSFKTANDWNR
ncbi:MAG: hypothetical protein ACYCYM_06880 [Saccharofermentanales bacterium]